MAEPVINVVIENSKGYRIALTDKVYEANKGIYKGWKKLSPKEAETHFLSKGFKEVETSKKKSSATSSDTQS